EHPLRQNAETPDSPELAHQRRSRLRVTTLGCANHPWLACTQSQIHQNRFLCPSSTSTCKKPPCQNPFGHRPCFYTFQVFFFLGLIPGVRRCVYAICRLRAVSRLQVHRLRGGLPV